MILTETIAAAAAADVEEDMVNRIKERSVMNTTIYNVELSTTRNGVDEIDFSSWHSFVVRRTSSEKVLFQSLLLYS